MFLFGKTPDVGDTVYIVNQGSVSDWSVAELVRAGHSLLYKLKKEDSFCVYEQSRLGKDMFVSKEDALKELSKKKG